MRASRQWRDLKSWMTSGLAYQTEQVTPEDGSMAIFCPACPQPGLNPPDDFKQKYSPYVHRSSLTFLDHICACSDELICTFIMDGNFSAEHMQYRTTEKDVALSPGMAFMSNPDIYKSHLWSGAELTQASINPFFM